jgi:hypothetical protein
LGAAQAHAMSRLVMEGWEQKFFASFFQKKGLFSYTCEFIRRYTNAGAGAALSSAASAIR